MNISFELPPNIEQQLRTHGADLNREAKEVYLIDLFRRGVVSHYDLGQALNLDRFETNALLNRHHVTERSLSHEDVDADVKSINDLLSRHRP
jgi:predicted HTH domain antitoxin